MSSSGNVGAAVARVAKAGGTRVDPPTLMPAETILELSGEVVRGRLCIFTDAAGRELCLRPDLTTPIADRVASGDMAVDRYYASGPVYRLPPRGSRESVEHTQVGFEWFGASGSVEEDAEAVAVALEAAQAGGVKAAEVRFGDVAIYRAVINALPLTEQ
ncbi:MAG TPA: ATP phosphoribosyltransferase regulatory subunit, partial [Hyphomonadaceae bacterium]|nr:ATP phosphoribosyltransferase regulatory subunit [Hyphomonadaceae bacterium]